MHTVVDRISNVRDSVGGFLWIQFTARSLPTMYRMQVNVVCLQPSGVTWVLLISDGCIGPGSNMAVIRKNSRPCTFSTDRLNNGRVHLMQRKVPLQSH